MVICWKKNSESHGDLGSSRNFLSRNRTVETRMQEMGEKPVKKRRYEFRSLEKLIFKQKNLNPL